MVEHGAKKSETICPEDNRGIRMDFQGATITLDTDLLLLRAMAGRIGILGPSGSEPENTRSRVSSKYSRLDRRMFPARMPDEGARHAEV